MLLKGEPTTFCVNCGHHTEYSLSSRRAENDIRGTHFEYVEIVAKCNECGEEIYMAEVNDANVQAQEDAYRSAAGLITVSEIAKILEKYSIGAGPLAKVMGYGDITINRYMGGQLPSKQHSEQLLEILASHKKMEKMLERNKEYITDVAYRKCRDSIDELSELFGNRKIEVVIRYLLKRVSDITPLALQKVLYYAQAFYYALFDQELFLDPCQAWVHGPVFPDVFYKYHPVGCNNPIEGLDTEEDEGLATLTTQEIELLDAIITAFACYSGPVLEKMTHSEKPWQEARGSLLPQDRSVTVLDRDTIHAYFKQVVLNYKIVNPCDIVNYSEAMRSRITL